MELWLLREILKREKEDWFVISFSQIDLRLSVKCQVWENPFKSNTVFKWLSKPHYFMPLNVKSFAWFTIFSISETLTYDNESCYQKNLFVSGRVVFTKIATGYNSHARGADPSSSWNKVSYNFHLTLARFLLHSTVVLA